MKFKMNSNILILILFSSILQIQTFDNFNADYKKPILLTIDTFRTHIDANSATFVLYYAPWCSHCKRLSPVFDSLAAKYNDGNQVSIAKVDCTTQTELCSDHDILAYPTLIFYKNSQSQFDRYDGQRDLDSLEKYIVRQLNEHQDESTSGDDNVVVASANALHDLNEANFDAFVSSGYHFVKFYAPWCSHCVQLAPMWKLLAEKLHNTNVRISHVDCTKSANLCKRHKIDAYPSLLFFHNGNILGKYQGGRTIEDFTNYLSEMAALDVVESTGRQAAAVETEESILEEYITIGTVIDATQDTMTEVIKDGLAFVKFYAPWCPHCRNMEATWNELASRFTSRDPVRIARVDCTNNAQMCMNYQIDGYPTLVLFKNGQRIKNYAGLRNLEDLYKFVEGFLKTNDEKHDEL